MRIKNKNSLESVYRKHFKKVYFVVKKYTLNDDDTKDIVHDIFIKFYNNNISNLSSQVSLSQELFAITKSVVLDYFKKQKSIQKLVEDYFETKKIISTGSEVDKEIIDLRIERIHNAIQKLPKKQQAVFKMHRLEGLTYDEIATFTKLSKNTISSHIATATQQIRKDLLD